MLEQVLQLFCHTLEPDFQDAMQLCSVLLDDSNSLNRLVSGSWVRLSLEFDAVGLFLSKITTGIIRALYFTAIHSGNDETSRKAIETISKSSWREATWESTMTAQIAQKRRFGK